MSKKRDVDASPLWQSNAKASRMAADDPRMSEALKKQLRAQEHHTGSSVLAGRAQSIKDFKASGSSGVPIKIMTAMLLTLTAGFAFDLYQKKKMPHQHVSLTDGIRLLMSRSAPGPR